MFGLIIVKAATESDAHIVALYFTIKAVVNFIYKLISFKFLIKPKNQDKSYLINLLKKLSLR